MLQEQSAESAPFAFPPLNLDAGRGLVARATMPGHEITSIDRGNEFLTLLSSFLRPRTVPTRTRRR
jgi:hypothetical protein